jgi:hypothetical protein
MEFKNIATASKVMQAIYVLGDQDKALQVTFHLSQNGMPPVGLACGD